MKKWIALGLALALLTVASCASAFRSLNSQQQTEVINGLTKMLTEGVISQAQYDALLAALQGGGWSRFLELLGTAGGSILMSLLAVLKWRGSVNNRNGLPPTI